MMKKTLVSIGLICLLAGIAILSILLVNCRGNAGCPKGQSCRDECPNAGCPKGQSCRDECPNAGCPKGQSCRDECPECKVCTGLNEVCSSTNKCVECISDKDCPSHTPKLHCTPENTCRQCNGGEAGDKQCGGISSNSETPYCGKDGVCYACINNADAGYRAQCLNWEQFFGVDPDMDTQFITPLGTCNPGGQCALTGITVNPNYKSGKYMYVIDYDQSIPTVIYNVISKLDKTGKNLLKN